METKDGLCWDHKQIENAFSIIWWHSKWEVKAMYNKITCFSIVFSIFQTFGAFYACLFFQEAILKQKKNHLKPKKEKYTILIFKILFLFLLIFGIGQ
jgi:hypothetical protein